jgi:hypothetical protein
MAKYTVEQISKIQDTFKKVALENVNLSLGMQDNLHGEVIRAVNYLVQKNHASGNSQFWLYPESSLVGNFAGYLSLVRFINPSMSSAVHNKLKDKAYCDFIIELQKLVLDFIKEVPNETNKIDSSKCDVFHSWNYSICNTCNEHFHLDHLENDGWGSDRCSECINNEMIMARKSQYKF